MVDRTYATILLVVLVALAGCNGLQGGGSNVTDGGAGTDSPERPDPIYGTPIDGSEMMDAHAAAIRDGGSFRYEQNAVAYQQQNASQRLVTNVSGSLDLETGQILARQNITVRPESEVYVGPDGGGYQRIGSGDRVQYREPQEQLTNRSVYISPQLATFVDGLNYTYAETTREGDTWVHSYTLSGLENAEESALDVGLFPPSNATSVESELRIGEDGVIRNFSYRVTGVNERGDTIVYQVDIGYAGVGSTTVQEPAWVPEARNASSR